MDFFQRLVEVLDYVMPDILNNDVCSVQPVDVAECVDYERNNLNLLQYAVFRTTNYELRLLYQLREARLGTN